MIGKESALSQSGDTTLPLPLPSSILTLTWCRSWGHGPVLPPSSPLSDSSHSSSVRILQDMMDLFQHNMGTFYEQSSWGLNLNEKKLEFQHPKARFLIVATTTTTTRTPTTRISSPSSSSSSSLVAFCHYRFELEDEEDNDENDYLLDNNNDNDNYGGGATATAVLYLYEIQVAASFQSRGIGQCLMALLEGIVIHHNNRVLGRDDDGIGITKIMLTVFRSNQSAIRFYTQRLNYQLDPTSPGTLPITSGRGNTSGTDMEEEEEAADYVILSKTINN